MKSSPSRTLETHRIGLTLVLFGFEFEPIKISEALSLEPSRTIGKKEQLIFPNKRPTWLLDSPCNPLNSSIEAQWEELYLILRPATSALQSLSKDLNVNLDVRIQCGIHSPPIYVPRDMVRFASSVNASIGVDLYFFPSEEDDQYFGDSALNWIYLVEGHRLPAPAPRPSLAAELCALFTET
jgi:hypothetical protein